MKMYLRAAMLAMLLDAVRGYQKDQSQQLKLVDGGDANALINESTFVRWAYYVGNFFLIRLFLIAISYVKKGFPVC